MTARNSHEQDGSEHCTHNQHHTDDESKPSHLSFQCLQSLHVEVTVHEGHVRVVGNLFRNRWGQSVSNDLRFQQICASE